MVDMASMAAFAGGLQSANNIARSLLGLKITGEVQAKVIELQSIILSTQSDALAAYQSQLAMLEEVSALKKKIADLERMGGERERYEMKDVDRGSFAYTLKPEAQAGEVPHWLCVPCFDSGHKSILQNLGRGKTTDSAIYGCPNCKNQLSVHWRAKPSFPSQGEA